MTVDVVDLREFYATPLGRAAKASLCDGLSRMETPPGDCQLVGLGYPPPLMEAFGAAAKTALVLMPARQGALQYPPGKPSLTALVDEGQLPLANASVDCLVLLHVLENTADPADVLEEAWRVLVPEGRLIVITANRRGLWARFEHTPFGNGRPFSRGQLNQLLRAAKLTPVKWGEALHFPPLRGARLVRFHKFIERIARRLWPVFSGVIIVEASKRLYQGIPTEARKARRVMVPVLSPQGARMAQRDYR